MEAFEKAIRKFLIKAWHCEHTLNKAKLSFHQLLDGFFVTKLFFNIINYSFSLLFFSGSFCDIVSFKIYCSCVLNMLSLYAIDFRVSINTVFRVSFMKGSVDKGVLDYKHLLAFSFYRLRLYSFLVINMTYFLIFFID